MGEGHEKATLSSISTRRPSCSYAPHVTPSSLGHSQDGPSPGRGEREGRRLTILGRAPAGYVLTYQ